MNRRTGATTGLVATLLATLFAGTSCRLTNMRPLEITQWSPETAVVEDPAALDSISITFSALPDEPRAESAFALAADGSPLSGRFEWDAGTMRFVPDEPIRLGVDYLVTVTGEAQDLNGNALAADFEHAFATRTDSVRPRVERSVPADGEAVPTEGARLAIEFSEPIDRDRFYASLSLSPSLRYAAEWRAGDAVAVLHFMEALTGQEEYTVSLGTELADLHGNTLAEPFDTVIRADPDVDGGEPVEPRLISALASFESAPAEWLESNLIDPPELTIYPSDQAESTAPALESWERFWKVELLFNTPVSRSDVESAIDLDPELPLSIEPRFAEFSDRFVLGPDGGFVFDRDYTLRMEGSVRSDRGAEARIERFTRFRVNGAGSRPVEVRTVTFLEDPGDGTIVGPLVADDELDLAAYDPVSGGEEIGFFDLYLAPAAGSRFDRFETAGAVSFDISNIAAEIEVVNVTVSPIGEGSDFEPSPEPAPEADEQIVRISAAIEDLENSGIVTVSIAQTLSDTYGNGFDEPWQLRLNQVSSP